MATELNPPLSPPHSSPPHPQSQPQPQLQPTDLTPPPKRQRRPSVRLGNIGDQPTSLRTSKPFRLHPNPKSSKSRPLTNLLPNGNKFSKHLHNPRPSSLPSKNLRIHRPPPSDTPVDHVIATKHNHIDFHHDDQEFQDFDPQASDNDNDIDHDHDSADDVALLDAWLGHNHRSTRVFPSVTTTRVSDSRADMGLDHFPESDSGNKGASASGLEDGVRNWMLGLGLGRYAPFFEIHEVDEEVLPHLTLDDLKDMGINAVGTRRKLYYAIQKLRKPALS